MDVAVHCFNCGEDQLSMFYEVDNIPVHSCLLMSSQEEALKYPKGNLRLGYCQSCGFIENVLFAPELQEYSSDYEETQGFSPRFKEFAQTLAGRLIEQYNLRDKTILEIGCGKGEFLVELCELGPNRGIGFDPAYVPERTHTTAESRLTFIKDFYSERFSHLDVDFIVCRHTLEHIQSTAEFLKMVRRSIGNRLDTVVYFEVPDVSRVIKEQAFWDIYYEHCSYFSLGSLAQLFRSCGFNVLNLTKEFNGQYLGIEASPAVEASEGTFHTDYELEQLTQDVNHFKETFPRKVAKWSDKLRNMTQSGKRVVLWGSGSKATAYLTTLPIRDEIEYVVDINPYKHGKFLAGTGHEIVSPMFLKEYRPDVVVAMNPIYCDEIQSDLKSMGVEAELIAV